MKGTLSFQAFWGRVESLGDGAYASPSAAIELGRARTVFTTHTPVPAGHEVFPVEMVRTYLGVTM